VIVIDDKIISDDIKDKMFVCHLQKCKGQCCVQGDGGAPLSNDEKETLPKIYEAVKPYLTKEGIETIARKGHSVWDEEDKEWTTPLRDSDSACAYVNFDKSGITFCGIERAYEDGKIAFRKPVSCHLYPIRITSHEEYDAINYQNWDLCSDACALGKELGVPLYIFLKDALIRKYGPDFYDALVATIDHMNNDNS